MDRPIAISLSPNTEPDDVRLAIKTLFSWWNWYDTAPVHQATEWLEDYFSGNHVTLHTSGRQALYDLLRALEIGQSGGSASEDSAKDEVIIQAFTCIAVPEPILWAGAKPVYADVDPKSLNLTADTVRECITSRTKAIIVQHTFGIPAPLSDIKALADEHNLLLIEDCAHAFGGQDSNRRLGTVGDAAILSFGRDKTISSIFGGAVVTKDKALSDKISAFTNKRQKASMIWIKQQLLHPILFSWILQSYFSGLGKALLIGFQKLHLLSKAVTANERLGKKPAHTDYQYPGALATLLNNQLVKLDRYTQRRQAIAKRYRRELSTYGIHIPIPAHVAPNFLRYPLLVEDRDDLLATAKAQHMLLGDWYDAPLVPKDSAFEAFYYKEGSCPNAEEIATKIINLPTYPILTDKQATQVIDFIKREVTQ